MIKRKQPSVDTLPTEEYLLGQAARRNQRDKLDISGCQCPYKQGIQSGLRVQWLTGYYGEFVEEVAARVRKNLGLA